MVHSNRHRASLLYRYKCQSNSFAVSVMIPKVSEPRECARDCPRTRARSLACSIARTHARMHAPDRTRLARFPIVVSPQKFTPVPSHSNAPVESEYDAVVTRSRSENYTNSAPQSRAELCRTEQNRTELDVYVYNTCGNENVSQLSHASRSAPITFPFKLDWTAGHF